MSFGPLSPTSSKTMLRHKKEHDAKSESDSSESEGDRRRENQFKRSSRHRRLTSDTTHDRSPNRDGEGRRRRHRHSDSDDDVENLPDRFDSHGKPLDGGRHGKNRIVTRSGEFHRPAQRPGGMEVHGGWALGGTDPEQIEKLVRNVTGALEGRKSWVSVIGEVLGGDMLGQLAGPLAGVLQPPGGGSGGGGEGEGRRRQIEDDDDDRERRHKRRR